MLGFVEFILFVLFIIIGSTLGGWVGAWAGWVIWRLVRDYLAKFYDPELARVVGSESLFSKVFCIGIMVGTTWLMVMFPLQSIAIIILLFFIILILDMRDRKKRYLWKKNRARE